MPDSAGVLMWRVSAGLRKKCVFRMFMNMAVRKILPRTVLLSQSRKINLTRHKIGVQSLMDCFTVARLAKRKIRSSGVVEHRQLSIISDYSRSHAGARGMIIT